jgi:DNA-binding GntR family transcriptional regulator
MRPIDDLGGFDCPTPGNPADSEPTAYNRIATALADRIASGVYATGCRLPSGSELCREFGVSPMTVRRALGDSAFRLDSLTGDWLDESAEIRLLSAEMTRADERVARILAVAQGERVVYLRRLVLHEGNPVMYHTEYIRYDPRRPLVESQLQLTSLHAFLDSGRARRFPRGELTLTAVALDAEAAETLGQAEGALALCLEHIFQERDRTPVSWGWFLMRAELFRLRARLGPE